MVAGPGAGGLQAAAPVQRGCLAAVVIPGSGGLLQLLADQVAGPVLVDPLAQPRPRTDQRLMGDLDAIVGLGEQPGTGVGIQHGPGGARLAATAQQVVAADRPPDILTAVTDLDQAQEQGRGRRADRLGPGG